MSEQPTQKSPAQRVPLDRDLLIPVITAYNGGAVRRLHTRHVLGEHSVARHSWGVAVLCDLLTEGKASANLLKAALYHDLSEQFTGDVPKTTKWYSKDLSNALELIERTWYMYFDCFCHEYRLAPEERNVFAWADLLDLMLACYTEYIAGNQHIVDVIDRCYRYLCHDDGLPAIEQGFKLAEHIWSAVHFNINLFRNIDEENNERLSG